MNINENDIKKQCDIINKDLNPEQRDAAETINGPVMVIAGAGAGKTRALIHRAATMLVQGIEPANIMIVTFTNKAAEEIKERLLSMVGNSGEYIVAGTFHSIVFREVLKKYPESNYLKALNINMSECVILDESDSKSLFSSAMDELNHEEMLFLEENNIDLKKIQEVIQKQRSMGISIDEFQRTIQYGSKLEPLYRMTSIVWNNYNKKCREANGIDFDDILLVSAQLLEREPYIAKEVSEVFKYLMLDEYQDTNPVQMRVMDAIAQHHNNIFVVGDEKQSIYAFRGSDINVIMGFKKRYKDVKQINMQRNYRSYDAIIKHANACADAMGQRLSDGQLSTERQFDEESSILKRKKLNKVSMVEFDTEAKEAETVVRSILNDIKSGTQGKEIALLYRNRTMKMAIEKELVNKKIPYHIIGDVGFYKKSEVKDFIAMIRFLFRPWDSMAAVRFVKAGKMRISDKAVKDAMNEGLTAFDFLTQQSEKRLKTKKAGEEGGLSLSAQKIKPFLEVSKLLQESIHYFDDPALISDTISELWDIYLRPSLEKTNSAKVEKGSGIDNEVRLENALHIIDRVEEDLKKGMEINDVIDDLVMLSEHNPSLDKDMDDKIRLMTLHASKGAEFDCVYMVGLDQESMIGNLGEEKSSKNEIEEARRLTYVGLTRAKKKSVMSYAVNRRQYGQQIETKGVHFIDEIEDRLSIKRMKIGNTVNEYSGPR